MSVSKWVKTLIEISEINWDKYVTVLSNYKLYDDIQIIPINLLGAGGAAWQVKEMLAKYVKMTGTESEKLIKDE